MYRNLKVCLLVVFILLTALAPLTSFAMRGAPTIKSLNPFSEGQTRLGCPIPAIQNIYSEPGKVDAIADWLLQGVCVAFEARSPDKVWIKISEQEKQVSYPGWVESSLMALEPGWENLSEIPYPPVDGQIKACVILANSLNIRTGPGTNYREIGHLLKDDCVILTARIAGSGWAAFERGWLSTLYLQAYGNLHDLPVVKTPPPDFTDARWDD